MTEFLIKHFVKEYDQTEKVSVRTSYGTLSGVVGIFCNFFLFIMKAVIGIFLNSISVMADAFNNLSDAGGAVIGLIGVRIAGMPADEHHPFGHGRMEYITALVISFLVIQVGFTFFKDSIHKIVHPEVVKFHLVSVIILLFSITIKIWLAMFNRRIGEKIDSKVMIATAADAVGDVITTAVTIMSIIIIRFTGKNIDGFVGLGVSLVIVWAGINIAKDTIAPLIGEAVDPEDYKKITDFVCKYDGILGTHDLIVHNYGPGRSMASIHAEVPNTVGIEAAHEVIDKIERDAEQQLGIILVIHMDPLETKNKNVLEKKQWIHEILQEIDPDLSFHDFRMVEENDQINLVFDLMVPYEYEEINEKETCRKIRNMVQQKDSRIQCVITVEKGYIANEKEE